MATKRVAIWTPLAPALSISTMSLPLKMPPAAIKGIFTALTTSLTISIVFLKGWPLGNPKWPPASAPSITMAAAPMFSPFLATLRDEAMENMGILYFLPNSKMSSLNPAP